MKISTPNWFRNTETLFRVFFVVTVVGLVGILWQFQTSFHTLVKAPGGSFTEGLIGAPRFINPVLAQSQSDKDLTKLIFSSLVSINHEGDIDYRLAEYIDISSDGKTYTLGLKKNKTFHDKTLITANDVLFTIEKIQDPLIKSPLAGRWQGVSVEKLDEHTVVFNLAKPFDDFLHNLEIGILPKHIWENVSEQEFIFSNYNTQPIGSGLYEVAHVSFKENGVPKSYVLHGTKETYINKITFIFFNNEQDMVNAYKKGEINAMYGFSNLLAPENIKKKQNLFTGRLLRVFGIFFNQSQQPLLQDKNIRQAIELGINKKLIVTEIFSGYAREIDSPFSYLDANSIYDQEQARTLIEKSGWQVNEEGVYTKNIQGEETILGFSLSILNTEEMQHLADTIATQLKDIGIIMTIRSFDQGNLSQDVIRPRQYDALLFGYEIEKPSDIYAFWHSSQRNDPGLNISLYANTTVDKELTLLRNNSEEANIEAIVDEIQDDVPAVFIYSPQFTYILPKNIKKDIPIDQLKNPSDRYTHIENWYVRTRHVWNFFVK